MDRLLLIAEADSQLHKLALKKVPVLHSLAKMVQRNLPAHILVWIFLLSFTLPATAYDLDVARTICAVGRRRGVSARVMLAAFETAIIESGCRNLNYGDRDSVGVFQQRPSQGWGTREQCMNVDYAANKFFDVARTRDICGPSVGNLAQCVQRSGFPHKYDQNEGNARNLMNQIGCTADGVVIGGGSGGVRNEAPCSGVGHCYNRDSESCSGTPKDKVNGQFACPTQSNSVICCDTSNAGGNTRNEKPCSDVGHCYNRDSERCDGSPQETVNGQFACPTQPNNVICCVKKNAGDSSGVRNESPCSSVGHCYNKNTETCSGVSKGRVNGEYACPTQPDDVICCDTSGSSGAGGVRNEQPCSDVGHCYNRDTEGCDGSPQGKVNGHFACPTQPDNIICCVNSGGGSGIKNEHPCSTVGHCYDRNTGSCPAERQATKVDGAWACPTQPDNIICCRN